MLNERNTFQPAPPLASKEAGLAPGQAQPEESTCKVKTSQQQEFSGTQASSNAQTSREMKLFLQSNHSYQAHPERKAGRKGMGVGKEGWNQQRLASGPCPFLIAGGQNIKWTIRVRVRGDFQALFLHPLSSVTLSQHWQPCGNSQAHPQNPQLTGVTMEGNRMNRFSCWLYL